MSKTSQVAARLDDIERQQLRSYAKLLKVPESQVFREALREKIDSLRDDPRIRAAIARQAHADMATVAYE